jgi:hypothetical protein
LGGRESNDSEQPHHNEVGEDCNAHECEYGLVFALLEHLLNIHGFAPSVVELIAWVKLI